MSNLSVENVVKRHLTALESGDLATLMADYADDAVMMFPDHSLRGKVAIENFFANVIEQYGAKALSGVQVLRQDCEGEIVYVAWVQHPNTPQQMKGSDTYLIRHNKIQLQAVYDTV